MAKQKKIVNGTAAYNARVYSSAVAIFVMEGSGSIYFCPSIENGRALARQIVDGSHPRIKQGVSFVAKLPDTSIYPAWPYHATCKVVDLLSAAE